MTDVVEMKPEDFYIRKDAVELAIRIYPHVSSHEAILRGAKAIEAYLRGEVVVPAAALPEPGGISYVKSI